MGTAAKISTPCIRFCKLEDGFCIGCNRSWEQIAHWSEYSEQKRIDIMNSLFKIEENERKREQT